MVSYGGDTGGLIGWAKKKLTPKVSPQPVQSSTPINPNNIFNLPQPQNFTPANANMDTPNGPVYAPAPGQSFGQGMGKSTLIPPQTPVAQPIQNGQNVAPPVQTGAQPAQPFDMGQNTPTLGNKGTDSYITQTGQYQYDFFSKEGQLERLQNIKDTLNSSFNLIDKNRASVVANIDNPTGKAALELAANHPYTTAAAIEGIAGVYKAISSWSTLGATMLSQGGTRALADTTPAVTGAGKVALELGNDSKSILSKLEYVKKIGTPLKWSLGTIGVVTSFVLGKNAISKSGEEAIGSDITDVSKDFFKNEKALRDAGLNKEADEIKQHIKDVKDALDSGEFKNIWNGKKKGSAAVDAVVTELSEDIAKSNKIESDNNKFANNIKIQLAIGVKVSDEDLARAIAIDPSVAATKKAMDDKAAAEAQKAADAEAKAIAEAAADAQAELDRQAALDEQRAYNEQQRDEQRAYNEAQQAKADAQAAFDEATATEASGGSTLTFGLLGSSGDVQFVDRDKASQAYFGKSFEDLTPAQRKLLMLSKNIK